LSDITTKFNNSENKTVSKKQCGGYDVHSPLRYIRSQGYRK